MRTSKQATTAGKPRGPYNVACDNCARRKIKCTGNKPVCHPCRSQGRQNECTWSKNPSRKPRSEAYVEAMHKRVENLRRVVAEYSHYADYLESLLEEHNQRYPGTMVNFRASRPSNLDSFLGQPDAVLDRDLDVMMGGDDNDQDSDDGHLKDPIVMAISIPPQGLQIEPFTQPSRFPALAENPDDIYVLMAEGVPPSHYNPAFDWSRHLPSHIELDRQSHDRALDLLFKFSTSWCLRIMPALFLRDMCRALKTPSSQMPPKTPHYSAMLHNALLALALALLDDPKFTDPRTRQCFADTAKNYIEDECRRPNLSVVHALAILASFHSSQGDQTISFMYFGMSARMSQALGLDTDSSEWVKLGLMDEAERLDRHWVSLTTFTQDVCLSLYVGREFCVPEPQFMPHIDSELDEMDWFYLPAGIAPQPNNLSKTFEATCRLLMIARRIMGVINGSHKTRNRSLVLDAMISDIDLELNKWESSLTVELQMTPKSQPTATPHKLMLHLAYWWLFILLHRPLFDPKSRPIHSTDREIDHVKLCRRAAENIMGLLSTWRTLYTLRYCPVTLIQTVFCAGTVHLLTATQAISGTRVARKEFRRSYDQATLTLQYLDEIGKTWVCATKVTETLRSLMKEHLRPDLDRKFIPASAAGPPTSGDIDDDEEENGARPSRSLSKSSQAMDSQRVAQSHSRTRSSGSGQSPISTSLNHPLNSTPVPAQVSPSSAQPLTSPAITISPAHDADTPSTAIPIRSPRSSSSGPSIFPDSWSSQPNFSTNHSSSFAHRARDYAQPISNYIDNPFSGNGDGSSSGDVRHPIGSQGSAHNLPSLLGSPSMSLSMLGGQTLSDVPFSVFDSLFPNPPQVPGSTGFNADNMELDNMSWDSFAL